MNTDHRLNLLIKTMPLSVPALDGLKILLAEDSDDNAFLVSSYLKNTGCQLDCAENGRVAVEKFVSDDFDVILMDMQMPEMNGYAATRWIRALEKRKTKPTIVIALTAYAMKEEIEKSLAAGCDRHLNKPITRNALLEAISTSIQDFKGRTKAVGI